MKSQQRLVCVYKERHPFVRLFGRICLDRENSLASVVFTFPSSPNKEIWPHVSLNLYTTCLEGA